MTVQQLNNHGLEISPSQLANLQVLAAALTGVEAAYGKPLTVTSGLRNAALQAKINPAAPKSAHLTGEAGDILDPDGALWTWVIDNLDTCVGFGLYMESKLHTPRWVHFQTRKPGSGNRIFIP